MTEIYNTILKGMVAKINAIEKTILESNLAEKYRENLIFWKSEMNSRIGETYLKGLFDDSISDQIPPEQ